MHDKLNHIIGVEWKAQSLLHFLPQTGPLLDPLVKLHLPPTQATESNKSLNRHIICIQGSFDPPTRAHLEVITQAIRLQRELTPKMPIELLILLSLQHVDKQGGTLLGFRTELLVSFLKEITLGSLPKTIALSNVARYIDLTRGIRAVFPNLDRISYVVGIDVYRKIFMQKYYSKSPLREVIPTIFQADFLVVGRDDIQSVDSFISYVDEATEGLEQLSTVVFEHSHFLTISPKYQDIRATYVREALSTGSKIPPNALLPGTLSYIQKWGLYNPTTRMRALQIAIQKGVTFSIKTDLSYTETLPLVIRLTNEVLNDTMLQNQIIQENQKNIDTSLFERWSRYPK